MSRVGLAWMLALPLLGCEDPMQTCRALCSDMAQITLERDAWPDGAYRFEVLYKHSGGGEQRLATCAWTLPSIDSRVCADGDAGVSAYHDEEGLRIFVEDAPARVELWLEDAEGEHETSIEPEYEKHVCGQDCRSAHVTQSL